MFVRLKTYLEALSRAERAEGKLALVARRVAEARRDLKRERDEVRRLTDVIVALKEQGMVAHPASLDEHWGSYYMDDYEAPEGEKPATRFSVGGGYEKSEAEAQMDAEVRAELEDLFERGSAEAGEDSVD